MDAIYATIVSMGHTFRDMNIADVYTLEAVAEELIESGEAFNLDFVIKYYDQDFDAQRETSKNIYDMDFARWGQVYFDHASPRELHYLIQHAAEYQLDELAVREHYSRLYES